MLKQGLVVKPLVMGILFTARIALAAAVRFNRAHTRLLCAAR